MPGMCPDRRCRTAAPAPVPPQRRSGLPSLQPLSTTSVTSPCCEMVYGLLAVVHHQGAVAPAGRVGRQGRVLFCWLSPGAPCTRTRCPFAVHCPRRPHRPSARTTGFCGHSRPVMPNRRVASYRLGTLNSRNLLVCQPHVGVPQSSSTTRSTLRRSRWRRFGELTALA
jgi:hypothetical protein